MNKEMILENFLTRKPEELFRHAVGMSWDTMEEKHLLNAVTLLSEWAGKQLWTNGYVLDILKVIHENFDYDVMLGVGISINAKRNEETVRQFCYQFVKLAEKVKEENEKLEAELNMLKSTFWYKTIQFIKIIWYRITHIRKEEEVY